MALLEWGTRRFTIPAGEVVAGSDTTCAIAVSGARVLPRHAVLTGQPDGQVVIRKAVAEADVLINGVRLGSDPTPLLHGDKVELGSIELTFVDERRSGSTQYVPAMQVPEAMAQARAEARVGAPTAGTGGRVVSLTDGREYAIAGKSLVFGREAGCDVVVSGKDVSRRHAEIMSTPKGYLMVDNSTNGTFVNEARVEGQRLLARADVIRIGEETFRFYADVVPAATGNPPAGPAASAGAAVPPASAPEPPAQMMPSTQPSPPPALPPTGASNRLQNTSFGMPGVKREGAATARPSAVLATMLVRAGGLKGTRLTIKTPVANVGRADYNDLVIPDESVSTAHAKLQRREGVWVVVDLDSTNGTFVDGEKVKGEAPIAPGAVVRFGEVSLVFEPTEADDAMGVAKGGGTKVLQAMKFSPPPAAAPAAAAAPAPAPTAKPPAAPAKPAAKPAPKPAAKPASQAPRRPAAQQEGATPAKKGKGCGAGIVVLLALGAALTWIVV